MVTLRLVGQHVLVDIATTIYLCEGGGSVRCGGCVSVEGVGGVVKENVCTYSGGDCFQVGVVCLYSEM